jgi:hypothetical protein
LISAMVRAQPPPCAVEVSHFAPIATSRRVASILYPARGSEIAQ